MGGTLPSGTVNFAAGQISQLISVPVQGDTVLGNETFTVTFSDTVGTEVSGSASNTGTILYDILYDDPLPTLSIAGAGTIAEGDAGTTAFNFTVMRPGDLGEASSASSTVIKNGTNADDFGATATLDLNTKPAPVLTVSGSFTSVPGIFALCNGAGGVSTNPAAATNLTVSFSGGIGSDGVARPFTPNAGPGSSPTPLLFGTLEDFGFVFSDSGTDTLEFLLGSVGGARAGPYGSQLLATLEGEFGTELDFFAGGMGF